MGTLQARKITLGYAPKEGAFALPVTLLFNTNAVQQISMDFFKEQSQGQIEFIQSVFIDNSQNPQGLALRFPTLQQQITVRTQMQGYFPLFAPNGAFSLTAVTTGNVDIPIIFCNVFINPSVWQSA
jgi:hypothetical protein